MEAPDVTKPGLGRCGLAEISEMITNISASLELTAPKISYEGLEKPGEAFVQISGRAMEMILWELVENAKKFHPQGSPAIGVGISGASDGIRIQIHDDGLTLSPDQLARMWIPYYQVEKGFSGQVPGMGLGLAMVVTLVWRVGGTCRAHNRTDGPGVVVELLLPAG